MRDDHLLADVFPAAVLDRLRRVADVAGDGVLTEFGSDAARSVLAGIDVLITCWGSPVVDAEVLDQAQRLRLIAHSAGTVKGHLDRAVWQRGVLVTTAAQANGEPVADFTLACILLAGKNALEAAAALRREQGRFDKATLRREVGNAGTAVGVIGASRVGRMVLERLRRYDYRVLLADPLVSAEDAAALGATVVPLERLMAESRIVSLHAPVLPSTIGMIGRAEFAAMPDGATFINTARGVLVDHDALRDETASGRLSAILDVTDPEPLPTGDPLYDTPTVLITPHIAGSMGNELPRMGELAVTEVERFAAGQPLVHPVSLDDLDRMA